MTVDLTGISEKDLRDEIGLTRGEEWLHAASETGIPSDINKTQVLASIYTVKKTEASNNKYSKAMNRLTRGLLVVATVQLIVTIVQVGFQPGWFGR